MQEQVHALLRRLPKVDEVLKGETARQLLAAAPRWAVVQAVRDEIERLRQQVLGAGPGAPLALDRPGPLAVDEERLRRAVHEQTRPSLRRVINATGVVIHTNLGRAPLPQAALRRIAEMAGDYSNLEYRLHSGERGSRHEHIQELLHPLTGAEAHLCVNNNAAAVLLMLGGLCAGRQVVVSRGELVEIGGSFRIPDVMRASSAQLCEVGTTNRTHLRDYVAAIGPNTAALLKVHQSNFAVIGFTAEVGAAELAHCAHEQGLLCLCDLGSGALLDPRSLSKLADLAGAAEADLPSEPTVAEMIAAGCDLVSFSCDKLLGGPQAGIICGRREQIDVLKKHPLMRALRPDKLTLLALCATLELYRDREGGVPDVPVLRMLAESEPLLRARAERLLHLCRQAGVQAELYPVRSAVGGGSLPLGQPRSVAVAVSGQHAPLPALLTALRQGEPPVVARIAEDRLLLDVRTLREGELAAVSAALSAAWARRGMMKEGEARA